LLTEALVAISGGVYAASFVAAQSGLATGLALAPFAAIILFWSERVAREGRARAAIDRPNR